MYSIEIIQEAKQDIKDLSDEILNEVLDYFGKYQVNPFQYSKPLYNQGNLKLEGYRKTYVAHATYRIVIKIENNVAKVVEVVAVGSRQDKEVYKDAHSRINK